MFFKLALLTASSLARADPSDSSDAALKITTSMVNLSADNRARRTDATGSIRAASKKTGTECSFMNSLKAPSVQADVGVLTCAEHESCIKDATSSLGGRCVSSDEEYEYASEFFVTDTHRRLAECSGLSDGCIECTMSDGTAGMKCDGYMACEYADTEKIGCGSCNNNKACYGAYGVISEGSCNDSRACFGIGDTSIIGFGSCNGVSACHGTDYNIGAGSCNGNKACNSIPCDVSDNQCNTDNGCAVGFGYCPTPSPTISPVIMPFYPDWLSGDMTCKNDGEAPQYMINNAATWMFDDINTCCTTFFNYNFNVCLGASYTGSGKYYPDWLGANEGCLEDVQSSLAPSYMMQSNVFLYTTLDECCERHYNYRVNECKGLSSAGSNKWFVDWKTYKCVKDCDLADGADCGGLADGFWDLVNSYTTKEECCRTRVSWDINGCMA